MSTSTRTARALAIVATCAAALALTPLPASALGGHVTLAIVTNPADGTDIGVSFDTATGTITATLDDDGGSDATHLERAGVDSDDPTVQMTLALPTGWVLESVDCINSSEPSIDGTAITITAAGAAECVAHLQGPTSSSSSTTKSFTSSDVATSSTSSALTTPLPLAGPPASLGSLATATASSPTVPVALPVPVAIAPPAATVAQPVFGLPLLTG